MLHLTSYFLHLLASLILYKVEKERKVDHLFFVVFFVFVFFYLLSKRERERARVLVREEKVDWMGGWERRWRVDGRRGG
jgi:hypothetical protein